MIESTANQKIKEVIRLIERPKYRREKGLFIAEGTRMFSEVPASMVECIYSSESLMKNDRMAEMVSRFPHEIVRDDIFKRISDTKTPQGVLMVLRRPTYDAKRFFDSENGLYLILNEIQDPGNLGTMLRTAEGAGVAGIIMDQGCVDLFNPKVIRSTMGAVFRVPYLITEDLNALLLNMKKQGIRLAAAHLQGNRNYTDENYSGPVGIMIGNEGNGLRDEISSLADVLVKIPMSGQLESLNAAISAALLMYEVRRQRDLEK